MKWWQKKVRGWTVPFWYTDTPLFSKKFAEMPWEVAQEAKERYREERHKKLREKEDVKALRTPENLIKMAEGLGLGRSVRLEVNGRVYIAREVGGSSRREE